MGRVQKFLWFVSLVVGLSENFVVCADNGYLNLLKPRSELNGTVFDVEMSITGGIYKSGYENNAKGFFRLHIAPYETDKILVSVDISKFSLQNGKVTSADPALEQPISENVKFIVTPLGKIVVQKNESEKNINFIRILSNFLIFDYDKFDEVKTEERSVFSIVQPTVYGQCKIQSVGAVTGPNSIIIKQFFDPRLCTEFTPNAFSDVPSLKHLGSLTVNNYRKYNLVRSQEEVFVLDSLQADQKIFWKPAGDKSLTHFFQTSYKIAFIEEASLSLDDTDFDFSNEKNLTLSTSPHDYFESERSFHSFESLHDVKMEFLVGLVKKGLKDIANIWAKHPIDSLGSDQPMAKELTRMGALLEFLTLEQFIEIWKSLRENTTSDEGLSALRAFYKISPNVGTEASVLFIAQLITESAIEKEVGEKMLTKLAGSIRKPTIKILLALKELAGTKEKVPLLTYSGVLGTAYRDFPEAEKVKVLLEEAKKQYYEKIESCLEGKVINNADDLRINIIALGNIRSASLHETKAGDILRVLAEIDDEMYMRFLVALQKTTSNVYVFELVLKILRQVKGSTELKAAALKIALMRFPSPEDFEVLARIMDAQTNYELFNLFESGARVLIEAGRLPSTAKLWLRHREPLSRSTAFHYKSSKDTLMGISTMGYILFSDTTWVPQCIFATIYQNFNGVPHKVFNVFVRSVNVEKFTSLTKSKITYEITISRGSKVILFERKKIDFTTLFMDFIQFTQDFSLLPFKIDLDDIYQHVNFDYFLPTDTGKNLHLYFNVPWMFSAKFNSLKVNEDSININALASFNFTAQSTTGMHLYHPHMKALQGSRELSSVHITKQLSLKFSQNDTLDDMNFIIGLTDSLTPLNGIRFQKNTVVFLNAFGGQLPNSSLAGHVTIDMGKNTKDLLLLHTDIGAKYHIQLVDYTAPPENWEFPQSLSEMYHMKPYSQLYHTKAGDFLVSHFSYITWNFLAHSAYTYHLKDTLEPCHVFPVKKYIFRISDGKLLLDFHDKDDKAIVSYKFDTHNGFRQFFRSGPRLESSGFCFQQTQDDVDKSELQFFYGTNLPNLLECPRDQFQFVLKKKSTFSPDQIAYRSDKFRTYSACIHQSPFLQMKDPTNSYRCAKEATMLRTTTTDMSYKNAPEVFVKYWRWWWNWFLMVYNAIPTENVPGKQAGELTLTTVHSMGAHQVEMNVFHLDEKYSLRLNSDAFIAPSIGLPRHFAIMEHFKPPRLCTVVPSVSKLQSHRHILHTNPENTWEEYVKIEQVSISGMKVSKNQLALKIQQGNQTITVSPAANPTSVDKYAITLGENSIDALPLTWSNQQIRTVKVLDTLFFTVAENQKDDDYGFLVGYNGRSIMITGSSMVEYNSGSCFKMEAKKDDADDDD